MAASTVTSKGRITIPKEIRERLRLRPGNRVEFQIDAAGQVILKPQNRDVRSLYGIIRSPRKRAVTLGEMDAAIAQGASHRR
jgi:antitoxin PrlF